MRTIDDSIVAALKEFQYSILYARKRQLLFHGELPERKGSFSKYPSHTFSDRRTSEVNPRHAQPQSLPLRIRPLRLTRRWLKKGAAIIVIAMHLIFAALAIAAAPNHQLAMSAHHLCSGVFVVGRDLARSPEVVIDHDVRLFDFFQWGDDFEYAVDMDEKTARVWVAGGPSWTAQYNGDQGCTILPQGASDVFFEPKKIPSKLPDAETQAWPTGDAGAYALAPEIDEALDWAMAHKTQYTRALVVVHKGKIIGERYAEGFKKNTPQISWSQGKSITSALIGVLVHQGELSVDDRAPVSEWHGEGDPRRAIQVKHLLRMSSGLDFKNYGIDNPNSWPTENEHFRIYHDAINVFDHAVDQPLEIPPDSQFRYRNSDPLTLGRIIRRIVEARGDSYLAFPREALFDKIGARDYVL